MKYFYALLIFICFSFSSDKERKSIADEMEKSLKADLLEKFYPMAIDKDYGGFLSTFTYDWKPGQPQNKMIVSQSRHLWVTSKAADLYPDVLYYKDAARQGFQFIKDIMWDEEFGGFYELVSQEGEVLSEDKSAYGNTFGIYGLAAYYKMSGDTSALNLAQKAFMWLENNSYDPKYGGYFQILDRDGSSYLKNQKSRDKLRAYKDQNSSIHLLEAFSELYQVWPDELVKNRLEELLLIIRDTITTDQGYLTLYLERDWTPVSYRDSTEAAQIENHYTDHVSFGHDVETAFLLLEASHVLGLKNDTITEIKAKKMVDHALANGWDDKKGGFYDEGYYFKGNDKITITHDTKNWWAQAEGLNTLLIMADKYPDDKRNYFNKFNKLWAYTKDNILDKKHGGWYQGGIDEQPEMKTALKAHIWKVCYHESRSLMHCIERLRGENHENKENDKGK